MTNTWFRHGRARSVPWVLPLVAVILGLFSPTSAHAEAGMHSFRLEGGGALIVTSPQRDRFGFGAGLALGYELRPIQWVGIEARFSMHFFPSDESAPTEDGFGSYYAPTLAVRAHPLAGRGVGDLWVSAGAALAFTGDVLRPSIEVGLGYEYDLFWWLRLGPYVRYHHVFQTAGQAGAADAGFLSFGLALSFWGEEPSSDRDGDGILDDRDACPDEAEDMDGFEDANGCPDPDNDGDGVLDGADACPNEAEDLDGFEDDNGCPDLDNDGDGVPDLTDRCPMDAEDVDGFQDDDGCPDLDHDGDGIPDATDRCQTEPETVNGFEDEDGCPDTAPAAPSATQLELEQLGQRVLFPRNRARVTGSSMPALRQVIQLLQEHPEIQELRIEAHASSEGPSEANMELSRRRAEVVVGHLVRAGIARERLTTTALGDSQPEHTDGSEESHALNRRAVFTIVRQSQ